MKALGALSPFARVGDVCSGVPRYMVFSCDSRDVVLPLKPSLFGAGYRIAPNTEPPLHFRRGGNDVQAVDMLLVLRCIRLDAAKRTSCG